MPPKGSSGLRMISVSSSMSLLDTGRRSCFCRGRSPASLPRLCSSVFSTPGNPQGSAPWASFPGDGASSWMMWRRAWRPTSASICWLSFFLFNAMSSSEAVKSNHLIHEKSPYLQQHAHNPVDWYPWGPEAIEKARREDKPILVSIGYSTCHWCHVMERESYEDPRIGELMNKYLVNIKIDREERPDLTKIYISALQPMTC